MQVFEWEDVRVRKTKLELQIEKALEDFDQAAQDW